MPNFLNSLRQKRERRSVSRRMPYSEQELAEISQKAIDGYNLPEDYLLEHVGRYVCKSGILLSEKSINRPNKEGDQTQTEGDQTQTCNESLDASQFRAVGLHTFIFISEKLRRHVCSNDTNKRWLRSESTQKKQTAIQGVFLTIFDEIGQPVTEELTTMLIALTSLTLKMGFDLSI